MHRRKLSLGLSLIVALALVLFPLVAFSEGLVASTHFESTPSFGIGAILGDPTALTLKYRLADQHAVQLYAGWGYIDSAIKSVRSR